MLHGRCMSGLLVKQNVSRAVDGSKIPHEHYLIRNAPRCPLALAQHLPHIEERLPRTSAVSMALLQVSFALTKALFLLSGLCCSTRALYLLHLPYCRSLSLLPGLFSSDQGSVAAPALSICFIFRIDYSRLPNTPPHLQTREQRFTLTALLRRARRAIRRFFCKR